MVQMVAAEIVCGYDAWHTMMIPGVGVLLCYIMLSKILRYI